MHGRQAETFSVIFPGDLFKFHDFGLFFSKSRLFSMSDKWFYHDGGNPVHDCCDSDDQVNPSIESIRDISVLSQI